MEKQSNYKRAFQSAEYMYSIVVYDATYEAISQEGPIYTAFSIVLYRKAMQKTPLFFF